MDKQYGYVDCTSHQRWLFHAEDKPPKCVVAPNFSERTITLSSVFCICCRLLNCVDGGWIAAVWITPSKFHVISKRYTQRIERHNLNIRQPLLKLGCVSLSFS
ncbi:IS1 family transposase [Rosenbergiella nectarea]|uniref:IS1 family transposase n=1 Tax=Rosenbergiella nectarea TaxID=988801 RepID=UPI003BACF8CA